MHHTASTRPRLAYVPGLDGLRALAVGAVLLYHHDPRLLPGGFLGVELFFVLSGYLITALLGCEHRAVGAIDLPGFWLRRARRLLPAMVALVAACLLVGALALRDQLAQLRGDAAAAMIYIANWRLLFDQRPYFAGFERPSLLLHLWSLAIEEQFYLLWPLALALGLRRGGLRLALALALAGAAASAGLMAALYTPG
ncbi:MAG: acyltransferase, partial [Chloroflexales bacterium]|nr:acyltransferase [Chloroflexales bacterium]